jgi:hypothetical protein
MAGLWNLLNSTLQFSMLRIVFTYFIEIKINATENIQQCLACMRTWFLSPALIFVYIFISTLFFKYLYVTYNNFVF